MRNILHSTEIGTGAGEDSGRTLSIALQATDGGCRRGLPTEGLSEPQPGLRGSESDTRCAIAIDEVYVLPVETDTPIEDLVEEIVSGLAWPRFRILGCLETSTWALDRLDPG
jgi:hypothetical protein